VDALATPPPFRHSGRLVLSGHQPYLMPWGGFWNKVAHSDLFVVTAGMKYSSGDYQRRVKLYGKWLVVPVEQGATAKAIKDVRIDSDALPGLARQIKGRMLQHHAPYYDRIEPIVECLLGTTFTWLLDLDLTLMLKIRALLGFPADFAVDLNTRDGMTATEKLVDICETHGGKVLLCGAKGVDYMDQSILPDDIEFWGQRVDVPVVGSDSVLQLIAHDPVAPERVLACGQWERLFA
jgi:hypothetical protein